ncbi:Fc receptor-like protein 5 isoform X2 [Ctenopharyngodon idella]|uniref:Fc receptor-like protein 5 isoform X2 n=1 Tax=Ctenopharyngodon idella TaxID=7959 RepID=UPI00222F40B7|nr:Fc receptor-like protein 5 isoform X2 [Ctenopharyngodon idella]
MELSQLPLVLLLISNIHSGHTEERLKPKVTIKPDQHVFRGDSVTLRCDIDPEGVTSWRYYWYKGGSFRFTSELQELTFSSVSESDAGKYSCYGTEIEGSRWSQLSDEVTLTVSERPKPKVTIKPDQHVFRGETVTLRCDIDEGVTSWRYNWDKEGSTSVFSELQELIFRSVSESDAGEYSCYGREAEGSRRTSRRSNEVTLTVSERKPNPKPKVSIKPDQHVFRGETVTLRCDIDEGVTSWRYNWYKGGSFMNTNELQELTFSSVSESDAGKYFCYGTERGGSRWSHRSDEVTLTVSDPRAVLSVSPQKWLTEGDPVTLICEVNGSSTGWTFSWFTQTVISDVSDLYELLSDSSRGSGGKYTVSSAALNHTGVYVCRAERGKPAYKTPYSNTQPLWVTGVSPPVSLIISPSRSQHFTFVSLSLSCENKSNSDGWTVRRYTDSGGLEDCSSSVFGSQTESTCKIRSTALSDTGVYWCQSESGAKSHPVNISVHSGVVLESPVHPVTERDTLTLHCLYKHTNPSNLRADFYKDGSLIQSQTTEMIIPTVSKSHEGFYYCKHPKRGESPKSWISVRDPRAVLSVSPQKWLTEGDPVTLICEVNGSSTGWTFSWFTQTETGSSDISNRYKLLSDSSRGSGGKYTVSSAALNHTGVYVCRAERGKPAYKTPYSNTQPLWVTGVSPPVSLIISPSRTQHFTFVSLSLSCENKSNSDGWTVRRYTDSRGLEDCSSSVFGSQTGSTCKISSTITSDTGVYWCQSESGEKYHPVNISVHSGVVLESPVHPVTEGDILTLHCLYQHTNPSNLRADFYKDGSLIQSQTTEMIIPTVSKSHEGFYYCKHPTRGESPKSWISVRDPRAVLSVSPQKWLTEGDPVTLICEVNSSSTGWTFSWFTQTVTGSSDLRVHYELLSDSSRGAGGKYTVSSAALNHTGVYVCRAERENYTTNSNTQLLWVTGVSPPVSLIISPSRTQHFTSVSLSLSCENKSNSDGWTVRRYTDRGGLEDCSSSVFGSQTGSTCKISSTRISHTGVYWCQSESGAKSHPVNISVHSGVILESPVHPVTEGDNLTLHCLYQNKTLSNLRADFYKDGSLIQNQTTEMIIPTVSKSHEGFYYCKHPEIGESPKSWISVRGGRSESPSAVSQQQNISQTSEQNQSEDGYKTLLSGTAHVYDSVDTTINRDRSTDGESGPTEITYAEIEMKSTNKQKKEKENKVKNTESCDGLYSELKLETDQGAGSSDVTYAQVK